MSNPLQETFKRDLKEYMHAQAKPRLTVVETIYLHQPGQQAVAVESKYARVLRTSEQPYLRRMTIGEEWTALDTGWLREVGLLEISNEAGIYTQTIPTNEARAEQEAKIIEVASMETEWHQVQDIQWEQIDRPVARWLIPPRESMRGIPTDPNKLRLRCQKGSCPIVINAFPA